MNLLQKAGRTYLVLTSLVLLGAGGLLYVSIKAFLVDELTEGLEASVTRISSRLRLGEAVPSLPPDLEIETGIEGQSKETLAKDTVLFDYVQNEYQAFREVSATRTINGSTVRITVRQLLLEPIDYLASIGIPLVFVLGCLLIGMTLINRRAARVVWQPFYGILEYLKRFTINDDEDMTAPTSDVIEFQELSMAIDALTNRIRSDYRSLKAFTENAAHETRTPLAVIQTQLDDMLQSPDMTPGLAQRLEKASSAAWRLSRLNQALLLLAKIGNDQFASTVFVDFETLLRTEAHNMEDVVEMKNLDLSVSCTGHAQRTCNPVLAETLLSNLLGNAVLHNIDGGWLKVEMDEARLTIRNTGPSPKLDTETLFQRFRKADPSRNSVGLGLAICRTICESYGWRITYSYAESIHELTVAF